MPCHFLFKPPSGGVLRNQEYRLTFSFKTHVLSVVLLSCLTMSFHTRSSPTSRSSCLLILQLSLLLCQPFACLIIHISSHMSLPQGALFRALNLSWFPQTQSLILITLPCSVFKRAVFLLIEIILFTFPPHNTLKFIKAGISFSLHCLQHLEQCLAHSTHSVKG